MAVIVPFRGLRYNRRIIKDLADVITPPYDMITPEEQAQLYRRNPYNLIRLEYGKTASGDHAQDNRYTRAAATLEAWLQDNVLLLDKQRSFYLYQQRFTIQSRTFCRTGLIAALKLEPYAKKIILPHEDTLTSPKADRLELLRRCRANFSPIFGLFADPGQCFTEICTPLLQKAPLFEFTDSRGESHSLWSVNGHNSRKTLAQLIASKQIFIADGHHRYDTALQYSQKSGPAGGPGSKYALAVLVPMEDPGLIILPFHRLLRGLTTEQLDFLLMNTEKHFEMTACSRLERLDLTRLTAEMAARRKEGPAMGLLLPDRSLLLTMKEPYVSGELDVSILKRLLLDPLLAAAAAPERHLDFTTSADDAWAAVLTGQAQAAFLLNPTPMEAVTARALKGENMPQKSTCFYPKLPGGLVIHHFDLSHQDETFV